MCIRDRPEAKADQAKPEAKADEPKPEAKVEPKSDDQAEPKPEAKTCLLYTSARPRNWWSRLIQSATSKKL